MLPQLVEKPRINLQDLTDGASLFVVGLFKKLALANYLGLYVDRVYAAPGQQAAPALFLATFAFAWQIYFDFSGYTDMARGVGRAFGLRLMLNFNNPYTATGLGDFWSRWHISLSTWFRDYVYTPLGGNRRGVFLLYFNLLLTFVVSGLWHGANWTFIIWGALHGVVMMLTRKLERSVWYAERVPKIIKQSWVFVFVCFTWIFFRAESLGDVWLILWPFAKGRTVSLLAWQDPRFPVLALALILSVWMYQHLWESHFRFLLQSSYVKIALVVLMILYLFIVPGSPDKPFIYFQF